MEPSVTGRRARGESPPGGSLLHWMTVAALAVASALPTPAGGQGTAPLLRKSRLHVVYSSSVFRTVSKNDAIAAMRVWVATVGRQKGFDLECSVEVIDGLAELSRRVKEGPPGVVLLDAFEYFDLANLGLLVPTFVGSKGKGDDPVYYALLVSRDSGVETVADLRGKTLVSYAGSRSDIGRKWLDALLHDSKLGVAEQFFRSVNSTSNPSAAVLPVFFGREGAGVVDRNAFEVMKEMNPQLGSKLRILAVSPPLADGILCIDKRPIDYREELLDGLKNLHQDAAGRQILLVFKSNKLKPVDAEILDRLRELWVKQRLISEKRAARITAQRAETADTLAGAKR